MHHGWSFINQVIVFIPSEAFGCPNPQPRQSPGWRLKLWRCTCRPCPERRSRPSRCWGWCRSSVTSELKQMLNEGISFDYDILFFPLFALTPCSPIDGITSNIIISNTKGDHVSGPISFLPPYTEREKNHMNTAHIAFCWWQELNPGHLLIKRVCYPLLHRL